MKNQIEKLNKAKSIYRALHIKVFVSILAGFVLISCFKSEYSRMAERELARGVRSDSLFLGLHFRMSKKDFYSRCMEMNRKHLVTNFNSKVMYKFFDGVDTIDMVFYPEFHNDSIYQMPVTYTYEGWSPWNKHRQPDSLQFRLRKLFEKSYSSNFIKVNREGLYKDFAYVTVEGNKRVTIFRENEKDVKAIFTDLLVENKLKHK
jgi:hypothetical protein